MICLSEVFYFAGGIDGIRKRAEGGTLGSCCGAPGFARPPTLRGPRCATRVLLLLDLRPDPIARRLGPTGRLWVTECDDEFIALLGRHGVRLLCDYSLDHHVVL